MVNSDDICPPTLSEMEGYLLHYGVKGMKWGVKRSDDGGASVTVAGRPTYTTAEIKDAQLRAKDIRKVQRIHKKYADERLEIAAIGEDGSDTSRLAKLKTKQQRVLTAVLGTKFSNIATIAAIGVLAATATPLAAVAAPAPVGAALAAKYLILAGRVHANRRMFYNNLIHNPKIKGEIKLNAKEYADYAVGRQFHKDFVNSDGAIRLSSMRGTQKLEIFDKEGRMVGSQTRKAPGLTPDSK